VEGVLYYLAYTQRNLSTLTGSKPKSTLVVMAANTYANEFSAFRLPIFLLANFHSTVSLYPSFFAVCPTE